MKVFPRNIGETISQADSKLIWSTYLNEFSKLASPMTAALAFAKVFDLFASSFEEFSCGSMNDDNYKD